MSKKKKAGVHLRWIKPDEEVPNMQMRFPACGKCRRRRMFATAIGTIIEDGTVVPVCEEHFIEKTEDPDGFDLEIDDIPASETSP